MSDRPVIVSLNKKSRGSSTSAVPAVGVYGNTTASRFLRDLMAGTDSLDVLVVGDSNAGHPGDAGYSLGWHRVMEFGMGVQPYATCMMAGGAYYIPTPTAGNVRMDGVYGLGVGHGWAGHNDATRAVGSTGGPQSLLQTANSALVDLRNNLNYDRSNFNDQQNSMILMPNGWFWDPTGVAADVVYSSQAHTNQVLITAGYNQYYNNWGSTLVFGNSGTGGNTLKYRLVHGVWEGYTGSFRLKCNWLPVGSQVSLGPVVPTSGPVGSGITYSTASLTVDGALINDFESSGKKRLAFSWDGFGTLAHGVTGPFAALWQSVIRPNTKGYAVSCLEYHGGLTTDGIADRLEASGKCLDLYLKEVRERQIDAGGSGRVLVYVNAGINDWSGSVDWTANMERIKTHIYNRWTAMGGADWQLCFVLVPSHPASSAISPNPWPANRAAVITAAQSWANANASDGKNACVVDIGAGYNSIKMEKYLLYKNIATDVAHLSNEISGSVSGTTRVGVSSDLFNAYTMITQSIVSKLLVSA